MLHTCTGGAIARAQGTGETREGSEAGWSDAAKAGPSDPRKSD